MSTDPRTAREIARLLAKENPTHRFAVNEGETIIGYIPPDSASCSYVPYMGLTLMKTWVSMPSVLVNGKSIVTGWIPISIPNPQENREK